MEKVVATVSGYQGTERFNLIKLIAKAGGNYVGTMNNSITHLVCWRFEGRKFELARKSGKIFIVNHKWIEECIRTGRRVQEHPYTVQCGQEVGPLVMSNITLVNENSQSSGHNSKELWIDTEVETEEQSPEHAVFLRPKKGSRAMPETSLKRRRLVKKNTSIDVLEISDSEQLIPQSTMRSNSANVERLEDISNNCQTTEFSFYGDHTNRTEVFGDTGENLKNEGASSSPFKSPPEQRQTVDVDPKEEENCEKLPTSPALSCVICWTDFSSSRGLLPCGHRFCFSCIQSWADQMISRGKTSTCPLCKVGFASITKVADAESSDQKIYSQTIPHNRPGTDIYILPDGETSRFPANPAMPPVCCQCSSREPEELLIHCHMCQTRCIHAYCLDPPLHPWTCIHCKDFQRQFQNYRHIW